MANLILIGFMCTGKTSVGKQAAAALGMKYVDSDALIEERAGKSIMRIFADEGERHFRRLERKVIAHLAAKSGLVIAVGGGALGDPRNLADLRRSGTLVGLSAAPETILQRAKKQGTRPLLKVSDPLARINQLLALRAEQYAQADYHVDTTGITVARAAARVLRALTTVPVALGERSYDIIIGRNLLRQAKDYISRLGEYSQVIVISEQRVWDLHGEALTAGLPKAKAIILPALDDQEKIKSLRYAEQLYDELLARGAKRDSLLIAFGGGTIGDLAGFVAATYMRGVDFVQVPTTLLAQVDSSVGGKVAVNHPQGKNLIGAFWQPRLVLADIHCLDTLPRQQFRNGLGEVIKHALLADERLFRYLEDHVEEVMRISPPALHYLLWRNCHIKAAVVSRDEREGGARATLNLGHTFAHALETVSHYHNISHGEAVAFGLAAAGRLACRQAKFSQANYQRVVNLLQAYHLPIELPGPLATADILGAMQSDKKTLQGKLRFVVPTRIGKVKIISNPPVEEIRRALGGGKGLSGGGGNKKPGEGANHG
jgi:shikimate kinase / 3-dehydroquinate synthase